MFQHDDWKASTAARAKLPDAIAHRGAFSLPADQLDAMLAPMGERLETSRVRWRCSMCCCGAMRANCRLYYLSNMPPPYALENAMRSSAFRRRHLLGRREVHQAAARDFRTAGAASQPRRRMRTIELLVKPPTSGSAGLPAAIHYAPARSTGATGTTCLSTRTGIKLALQRRRLNLEQHIVRRGAQAKHPKLFAVRHCRRYDFPNGRERQARIGVVGPDPGHGPTTRTRR